MKYRTIPQEEIEDTNYGMWGASDIPDSRMQNYTVRRGKVTRTLPEHHPYAVAIPSVLEGVAKIAKVAYFDTMLTAYLARVMHNKAATQLGMEAHIYEYQSITPPTEPPTPNSNTITYTYRHIIIKRRIQ